MSRDERNIHYNDSQSSICGAYCLVPFIGHYVRLCSLSHGNKSTFSMKEQQDTLPTTLVVTFFNTACTTKVWTQINTWGLPTTQRGSFIVLSVGAAQAGRQCATLLLALFTNEVTCSIKERVGKWKDRKRRQALLPWCPFTVLMTSARQNPQAYCFPVRN